MKSLDKKKTNYKPCSCPKGGIYDYGDGHLVVCDKCGGSEWVKVKKDIKPNKLEWEKEFENKFLAQSESGKYKIVDTFFSSSTPSKIKSFIKSLLDQQREKVNYIIDSNYNPETKTIDYDDIKDDINNLEKL